MLGEPISEELDLLPFEKYFRAYIGFIWFHAAATETAAEVCSRLQHGVNRTVEATPVLSGTLKEDASGRAYVAYNTASSSVLRVQLIHVGFSFAEISESGFDQNKYREELFMDQRMLLSAMPGINDVPVLRVQLFWMQDGGWAVGVLCHHVLADAYAAFRVAQSIGRAAKGKEDPLYFDASRAFVADALVKHEPQAIPSITHVRGMFAKHRQREEQRKGSVLDGQMRRRQIRITADAIGKLKQGATGGTANTLVMALLWRAWTRILVHQQGRCVLSSAVSDYTYIGWPIDMRRLHASKEATSRYLGNLFLPYTGHATKRFVLDQPLAQVAMLLAQMTQSASLGQLRAFSDSVSAGEPDVRGLLEETSDSPMLSFSNMTKLSVCEKEKEEEEKAVVDFGAGSPTQAGMMQMLAIDAPMMMFAIDDGAGGMLINGVMPSRVADAFATDAEFAEYADLVY